MKVMFAGGGTGGHLYPAVAMAEELQKLRPGTEVSFAGTQRGIEAVEIPRLGYRLHLFRVRGLRRGLSPAALLANAGVLADFAGAMAGALRLLGEERPDVVVGTGGFVSGPLLLAAQVLGRKTLIQEQNAYPGVTTRLLALRATEVHLSFPGSRRFLKRAEGVYISGNPARAFPRRDREEARETFGLDPGQPTLLVFGGSRGASSINEAVRRWIVDGTLGEASLVWQTGELDYESVREEFRPSRQLWIGPYIDDMGSAYAAADLVLCRAGASSVAELTNLGKPAVLVPYPHATGDHQRHNAEALVREGAAELVPDGELAGERTGARVSSLLCDSAALARMGAACRKQGRPEAARELAERILKLANT